MGEHDIIYKPRLAVKEHILADFLAESHTLDNSSREDDTNMSWKSNTPTWALFTDGASSIEGSGAGLILTDLDGRELTYALRFNFRTSNNEAEYEALVARLELTIQMEAQQKGYLTPWLRCVGPEQANYVLRIIVSDNEKQFSNNPFREWCEELEIKQNFTSGTHPQANGQTEVINRTILQGLKAKLDKAKSLVYGSEPVIPPEIGLPTYRISNFDPTTNDINHRVNLDLL
ncbi:reverse transcriptase domain-containing protein [Tanacetum coccineum]